MGFVTFSHHRNNIWVLRSVIWRWAGHVAPWGRRQTMNRVILRKTKEIGRLIDLGGRKLEDNIEMGFQEIWWRGLAWTVLIWLRIGPNGGLLSTWYQP